MKMDLKNRNKYVGKRIKKGSKFKANIVAGILSGALIGGCFINFLFPKLKDSFIRNIIVNSHYFSLDDEYSKMSKEDRCEYVVHLFCDAIDRNLEFSLVQKEKIKGNISKFLGEWGYLYNQNVFPIMEATLVQVDLKIDDRLLEDSNMLGYYLPFFNLITVDDSADIGTLCHETIHTITSNSIQYYTFNSLITEGIVSNIDKEYYNTSSYNSLIRNQIMLFSEIVGRENLIRCYLNCDSDSLNALVGDDNQDLFDLFQEEYLEIFSENHSIYENTAKGIALKLKEMYESKYHKCVNEDAIVYALYNACLPNSFYSIDSTLFYKDKFSFSLKDKDMVVDVSKRNTTIDSEEDYVETLDLSNIIHYNDEVIARLKNDYLHRIDYNIILNRLKILFGNDVYFDILGSSDVVGSLKLELSCCGVRDNELDIFIYKIIDGSLSDDEWSLLYCNEFKRLYDDHRLDIAVSNMKVLVGGSRGVDILKKIVMSDNNFSIEMLNRYLGFYWEDQDYVDDRNSIIGYNYFCEDNEIILPNMVEYEFYNGSGEIYPNSIPINDEYVQYVFDGSGSIYIIGNQGKYTCRELESVTFESRVRCK